MSLKHHEIEAIVEEIVDYITDEIQTHFSKEADINYALDFLLSKVEKLDVDDF